jgi:hypothetical protein
MISPTDPLRDENSPRSASEDSLRSKNPDGYFARIRTAVLPPPVSSVHAAGILMLGFGFEAGTEAFQLLDRSGLGAGWIVYGATLGATIFGFYLMFLGLREWHHFHPRPRRPRTVPWLLLQLLANAFVSIGVWVGYHSRRVRRRYYLPWAGAMLAGLATWAVATVMIDRAPARTRPRPVPWRTLLLLAVGTLLTAIVGRFLVPGVSGSSPLWAAWPVGGIFVVLIGRFFLDLRAEVLPWVSKAEDRLALLAVGWSIAVAALAGWNLGERIGLLLNEFVSNWVALIASAAPIVVALSPLCGTYVLLMVVYGSARRRVPPDPALSQTHPNPGAPDTPRSSPALTDRPRSDGSNPRPVLSTFSRRDRRQPEVRSH